MKNKRVQKRFLYLMEYYPPTVMGGAEISGQALVESLAEHSHQVTVLTPNYKEHRTTVEERGTLRIIRFKSFRYHLYKKRSQTTHKMQESDGRPSNLFYTIINRYAQWSARELRRQARKELKRTAQKNGHYDYVGANNYESILALDRLRIPGKQRPRKIAHLRDFALFCTNRGMQPGACEACPHRKNKGGGLLGTLMRRQVKRIDKLSRFDHILAISTYVKRQYTTHLGVPAKRIAVLYNPVSTEAVSPLSQAQARKLLDIPERTLLFVGVMNKQKGAHLIPQLAREFPKRQFLMVGSGPLEENIRKTAEKNALRNLRVEGYQTLDALRNYYRACDTLLVPSLWNEPLGRVVIEGAANGCTVIASDRGALPEIVTHLGCGSTTQPTVEAFSKEIRKAGTLKRKYKKVDYYKEYVKTIEVR